MYVPLLVVKNIPYQENDPRLLCKKHALGIHPLTKEADYYEANSSKYEYLYQGVLGTIHHSGWYIGKLQCTLEIMVGTNYSPAHCYICMSKSVNTDQVD